MLVLLVVFAGLRSVDALGLTLNSKSHVAVSSHQAPSSSLAADEALATSTADDSEWSPEFYAPQLTPEMFLIISSPTLKKIVYTSLKNFKSKYGRTFVLIDSGLSEPTGIAVDHNRGHLYVADKAAKAIFRYTLKVSKLTDRDGRSGYALSTDSSRITMIKGHGVEWLAVDPSGALIFSSEDTKDVKKVEPQVLGRISDGSIEPDALTPVSEKELEAMSSASAADAQEGSTSRSTDSDALEKNNIFSLYEYGTNPKVAMPGGVATDGVRLYFSNQVQGQRAGSVVAGEVSPKAPPGLANSSDPMLFPAVALSNATSSSYGVAKTSSLIVWTSSGVDGGKVYAATQDGGNAVALASGLGDPRGIVWDSDNTVYVADTSGGTVWSMPSGRLMDSVPVTKSVEFEGAFGVALLMQSDPGWLLVGGEKTTNTWLTVMLIVFAVCLAVGALYLLQRILRRQKMQASVPPVASMMGGMQAPMQA
eukprot:TRINITY_DN63690_c0_g1_i1.p1 TRINITY_DN63690_c0_g1~~TRINITY_DN63690_c0_g1_i1.p1  ORF type:complete len:514 (-),score=61.14 TRINITY_DN63690_c0_g1_i1:18-1451(-)